jgi:hypothetical protein
VEFGHHEVSMIDRYGRKRLPAKAEYKIKKGKRFLKIDGKYQEVELKQINNKGDLRVMPI